jgi:hypothetical protein
MFLSLFSKAKQANDRMVSKREDAMRGGLCLQYVSLTLAQELSEEDTAKLFKVAKHRFPLLKNFEVNKI